MNKTVTYEVYSPPTARTSYAKISHTDKHHILKNLQEGLNHLNELSNMDEAYLDLLTTRSKYFGKHPNSGKGIHNSIGSFIGGILNQHVHANRDFSMPTLKGIEVASEFFNTIDPVKFTKIQFNKGTLDTSEEATKFDALFDRLS